MTFVIHGQRTPCRKRVGSRKTRSRRVGNLIPVLAEADSQRRGPPSPARQPSSSISRDALCPSVSGICASGPDQRILVFAVHALAQGFPCLSLIRHSHFREIFKTNSLQ